MYMTSLWSRTTLRWGQPTRSLLGVVPLLLLTILEIACGQNAAGFGHDSGIPCDDTGEACPELSWCDLADGLCRQGCDRDEVCGAGEVCDIDTHECTCEVGTHRCGESCVSDTETNTCGAACTPCPSVANGVATCDGMSCGLVCQAGYQMCEGTCYADGTPNNCIGLGGFGACIAPGWCWEHPLPGDLDLNSVVAFGADDVWAAGEKGIALHWDGTTWQQVPQPELDFDVQRLAGTDSTNLLATGSGGVRRWDGSAWTSVAGSTSGIGIGVWSPSFTETWALVADYIGDDVTVRHQSGGSVEEYPGVAGCTAVFGTAVDSVWAGCPGGHRRWNGSSWLDTVGGMRATDYDEAPTGELFAIGSPIGVQRYTGAEWVDASIEAPYASRLSVVSPEEIWFAGLDDVFQVTPETEISYVPPDRPRDVAAIASNDVWIVGSSYLLQHWNGTAWTGTREIEFTDSLLAISDGTQGGTWAVGENGLVTYFDGMKWVRVPTPTSVSLRSVWASSATHAWVVGDNGTVLDCVPNSCTTITTSFGQDLMGVWGAAEDAVWAVGDSGRVVFFDGATWAVVESPTSENLATLHGTGASDVWIGGRTAFHWDGMNWEAIDTAGFGNERFTSIYAVAPNDVWFATGSNGFRHWVGGPTLHFLAGPSLLDNSSTIQTVFGLGSRLFCNSIPTNGNSKIYEWDGAEWNNMAGIPYEFGRNIGQAASLMSDGSMRFIRAANKGPTAKNIRNAILFYDPLRAESGN